MQKFLGSLLLVFLGLAVVWALYGTNNPALNPRHGRIWAMIIFAALWTLMIICFRYATNPRTPTHPKSA